MINTPTHSSLTKSEFQQEREKTKEIPESNTVKEGDKFTLKCGHEGRVVWVSSDGKSFGVQGVRRSCKDCGKGSSGSWTPTVYLFSHTARAT